VLPKETASHGIGIGQDREPSTLTNGGFEHLWWNLTAEICRPVNPPPPPVPHIFPSENDLCMISNI
jgi:hypothetical protein